MAPMLRSDTTALQHILAVLLDQPTTVTGSAVPPFRACFLAAGVTNATNFVSITPDTYGGIDFSTGPDGSEADSKLRMSSRSRSYVPLSTGFPKSLLLRLLAGLIWTKMPSGLGAHSPRLQHLLLLPPMLLPPSLLFPNFARA
jgi:hypothetical protein